MPGLMGWADLAVAAGGTTAWELAFMGVPAALLVLADNQRPVVAALAEAGAAEPLNGWGAEAWARALGLLLRDPGRRAALAARAQALADGRGAERVAAVLGEDLP